MNEIITKLYEIEENAESILMDTKRQKEQLQYQIEQEQIAYAEKMEQELQKRLEQTGKHFEMLVNERIAQLEGKHLEQIKKLDELYDEHLNELAEQIFIRIIEV